MIRKIDAGGLAIFKDSGPRFPSAWKKACIMRRDLNDTHLKNGFKTTSAIAPLTKIRVVQNMTFIDRPAL